MSEQWTPKADDFRQVWAAFSGYGGLVARPHSVLMDEGYAEFDCWLAKVKADAWDEGYRAGADDMSDLRAGRLTFQTITGNPYRQEATR